MDRISSDTVRMGKHYDDDNNENDKNDATNTTENCKMRGFNRYY
jgi:hypothetical protein